jgi:hypothetical protein
MHTFGEEMRSRLQQLHIGVRRVDECSRQDAGKEHNGALHISRYRLRELQQNPDDITVAEIAELAKLCHTTFKDLLSLYLSCYPRLLGEAEQPPSTHLLPDQACEWPGSLASPCNETGLLPSGQNHYKFDVSSPLWPVVPTISSEELAWTTERCGPCFRQDPLCASILAKRPLRATVHGTMTMIVRSTSSKFGTDSRVDGAIFTTGN